MTTSPEELIELRRAVRSVVGAEGRADPPAIDPAWREHWPRLAEMGLSAFCVPEELGGFGHESSAALVASRELGAALHGSPYPAAVAATAALSRWLAPGERELIVGEIMAGSHVPSIAILDSAGTLTADGDHLVVTGRAPLVLGAAEADSFLVIGPNHDTMGFVRRDDARATSFTHEFDVTRSCRDLAFSDARASRVNPTAGGAVEIVRLFGLLLAGDAIGGVERMLERTNSYAKGRRAFGTVIGGFQAVQHRLVDHTVTTRGMSLLADDAAHALAVGAPEAHRKVLLAEARVAASAVHVLHDLLQLTGAIGFTWEHGLHLYERRAHLDARVGGNPRRARQALAVVERWASDHRS